MGGQSHGDRSGSTLSLSMDERARARRKPHETPDASDTNGGWTDVSSDGSVRFWNAGALRCSKPFCKHL